MKVTLADSLGTCFGVQDAIQEAMDPKFHGNLTIIGQLVHNPQIVQKLRDMGVKIVNSIEDPIDTPNVMITAHGAARSVHEKAQARNFTVYDATCPLVMKVHRSVQRLVQEGYFPVVIGQASHVEVRGIVTDLKEYIVIYGDEDLAQLKDIPRIGIVCQTTNQIGHVLSLVEKVRQLKNPDGTEKDVKFIDTICRPTKDRQVAVEKLSNEVDLMIVIGGRNSSNTKKLKKVCDDKGLSAHHIEQVSELEREWFIGINHVGITAGTSTPSYVIDEIYNAVVRIGESLEAEMASAQASS